MKCATAKDLHAAVCQKDRERVKALLQAGVDVNYCISRETAATKALQMGDKEIVSSIISLPSFNPNAANQFEQTPLYFAAKQNDVSLAERLLNLGAKVDEPDILGVTPLGAAAWYDNVAIASLLIGRGAEVNKRSYRGETPLYRACSSSRCRMALFLMENGATVNTSTDDTHNHPGHTPLMAALSGVNFNVFKSMNQKNIENMVFVMKELIRKGCNMDAQDFKGRTALCLSVLYNNVCAVSVLLEEGCAVDVTDITGLTPLHWALQISEQRYDIAKLLVLYGANVDVSYCDGGQSNTALTLLKNIEQDPRGSQHELLELSLLIVAASNPYNIEQIRAKAEKQESPRSASPLLDSVLNHTRLKLSSCCKHTVRQSLLGNAIITGRNLPIPGVIKRYLNLGYDTKRFDPRLVTELYVAIGSGNVAQIRSLVEAGISLEAPLGGRLPLTLAAELNKPLVAELLLSFGANPRAVDLSGDSALLLAAKDGYVDVARVLLRASSDLEQKDNKGMTALLQSALNGHYDVFRMLLGWGSDPTVCRADGISVLHLMAGNGNAGILNDLLGVNSLSPDLRDAGGATPLHFAASGGELYGASLRLPALYRARNQTDHTGVIRALVTAGCDILAHNSLGQTALDVCTNARLSETQIYLLDLMDRSLSHGTPIH